jgi:hypothetical protein
MTEDVEQILYSLTSSLPSGFDVIYGDRVLDSVERLIAAGAGGHGGGAPYKEAQIKFEALAFELSLYGPHFLARLRPKGAHVGQCKVGLRKRRSLLVDEVEDADDLV